MCEIQMKRITRTYKSKLIFEKNSEYSKITTKIYIFRRKNLLDQT